MKSSRLLIALLSSGFAPLSFAQRGTFSPEFKVFNYLNYTAGSDGIGVDNSSARMDVAGMYASEAISYLAETPEA